MTKQHIIIGGSEGDYRLNWIAFPCELSRLISQYGYRYGFSRPTGFYCWTAFNGIVH